MRLSAPFIAASFVLALTNSTCSSPTAPDQRQRWGSDQASLSFNRDTATLQVASSGNCYGSYGEIPNASRLTGTFSLAGTYVELTGVAPGSRQYAAEFTGTVGANQMTLTVTVPSIQRTLGPFTLSAGVEKMWPPCRFP
jgi:hypothetical protein